jgi:hexosaminidase
LLALSEVLWSPAPPLAAAAGPQVGDPAVIGRDFTEFWGRVQEQYALLDALGARPGHEARPVTLTADWEPGLGAWQVGSAVNAVVPAGAAVIRWREGEGAPTAADATLDASAVVAGGGRVSARLFIDDVPYGETAAMELTRTLALERDVSVEPAPSAKYAPRVTYPLTDGTLGRLDHRDGTWLAWEGVSAVVAVVDLGDVVSVRSVRARFLQNANSWIWVPLEVAFAVSTTGDSYREIGRDECRVPALEQVRVTQDFVASADSGTMARFVKVTITPRAVCPDWHPGVGRPAWVFWGQAIVE